MRIIGTLTAHHSRRDVLAMQMGKFVIGEFVHFDGHDDIGSITSINDDTVDIECNGAVYNRRFDCVYPLIDVSSA